ncbi:YueI family protein [Oceanobacillus jordanicus]|uniref:YueI family protein n=1 Tax=Oceanobacillus jordanicus TaxID=2867266 RepID=A0AAW5B4N4_9BACI|nr:YueI family protein [Oceanobacillus jordanicus]
MANKNVDDYLTEGMYGTRLPKDAERKQFLGTLRERIVIALTIGQVMTDKGVEKLEEAMKENPNTTLLINGQVSYRFLKEEKDLAKKYNITYTTITNEESDTEIGAVLTYDYAIDKEQIFIEDEPEEQSQEKEEQETTFLSKIKRIFLD